MSIVMPGGSGVPHKVPAASVVEGESATFVPLEEDNSTLRYFAATEVKNHERLRHPDARS